MKKKSKLFIVSGCLMVAFLCAPALAHAQIGDPKCDPLCNCYPNGNPCPIDGGLLVLLASGVAYGIKRMKGSHKNDIETSS